MAEIIVAKHKGLAELFQYSPRKIDVKLDHKNDNIGELNTIFFGIQKPD